jgi:peptide/nickel transport system permease protein
VGSQAYLGKKILGALLTLLFILTFNFFLFRIIPGDPVRLLVRSSGTELSPEQQEELRARLGLDKPIFAQYFTYLGDTLTLDLGVSTFVAPGESVTSVFLRDFPKTLILVGTSTAASIVIGLWLGVRGGWRRGSTMDVSSMGGSLVLYSMPEYVLGIILLLIFAGWLRWFPTGGYESVTEDYTGFAHVIDVAKHMFLPWMTLMLAFIGEYYLVMRSSLLDVLGEEYITLARAKGVREKFVLRRHAVRNALLPTVTLIALSFGFVLGGAITIELVFSYPGVGKLSVDALSNQDYPLLQGTFLFFSIGVLLANLVADILYGYLDPRVRSS